MKGHTPRDWPTDQRAILRAIFARMFLLRARKNFAGGIFYRGCGFLWIQGERGCLLHGAHTQGRASGSNGGLE